MDCKVEMEGRMWQYAVPNDILSHISDFLPLQDWINFRGVCRSWRKAPSRRSNIIEFSKEVKWCIFYDCDAWDKDMCYFYQEGNPKGCSVRLPILRGATCLMSSFGWLLIRRNNNYIFFNPLTHAEIFLPQYPTQPIESPAFQVGTFSALPTSTECIVVLVTSRDSSTLDVAWCYLAYNHWLVDKVNIGRFATLDTVIYGLGRFLFFGQFDWDDNYTHKPLGSIHMSYHNRIMLYQFVKKLRTEQLKEIMPVSWYYKKSLFEEICWSSLVYACYKRS